MADKVEVELKVPFKYARMWPREVFYRRLPKPEADSRARRKIRRLATQWLYKTMDLLAQPGVYVLYLDGVPYYVGQTDRPAIQRLRRMLVFRNPITSVTGTTSLPLPLTRRTWTASRRS